jgi:hypothetical protein
MRSRSEGAIPGPPSTGGTHPRVLDDGDALQSAVRLLVEHHAAESYVLASRLARAARRSARRAGIANTVCLVIADRGPIPSLIRAFWQHFGRLDILSAAIPEERS